MKKLNVGVLVGSLRKESFNLKTAKALIENAPDHLSFEFLEIGNLPFYSEDTELDAPQVWKDYRQKIKSLDAFLLLTPEYNRSVPAVLKNALDVASRPWGENLWSGKPAGVVSVSIGAIGGFGANHHLRQSLVFLNVPTMAQPEAYIGEAMNLYDESGKLTSEETRQYFKHFMKELAAWYEKHV